MPTPASSERMGSSDTWHWDYEMDHNTYAVNLVDITKSNQLFSAVYYVYIGDANGNIIFNNNGSSTGTTETWVWEWSGAAPTIVPEPATLGLLVMGLGLRLIQRRMKYST